MKYYLLFISLLIVTVTSNAASGGRYRVDSVTPWFDPPFNPPLEGGDNRQAKDSLSTKRDSSYSEIVYSDFMRGVDNGIDIFTGPARYSSEDWITAGSVLGATALCFTVDSWTRDMMQRSRSKTLDRLTPVGAFFGDAVPAVVVGASIYVVGLANNRPTLRETGAMTLEALLYAGVLTNAVKSLAGRSRPYVEEGVYKFHGFQFNTAHTSLPSGHCAVALALSTVLAHRIDYLPASIVLYGLAGLTAVQRMYTDNHWFSDTVLGSAIGYFMARAVIARHEKTGGLTSDNTVQVYPVFAGTGNGIGLTVSF